MKPKFTERSEGKFVAEFDPPPLFLLATAKHKSGGGFNSHSDLCSLTFHKSRAH